MSTRIDMMANMRRQIAAVGDQPPADSHDEDAAGADAPAAAAKSTMAQNMKRFLARGERGS